MEKSQFETRVLATRTLWEGVRLRSDNRHVVIERVFPLAHNYDDAYRVLNVWLRETEQKVINLAPVPCTSESLINQYRNLAVSNGDKNSAIPSGTRRKLEILNRLLLTFVK